MESETKEISPVRSATLNLLIVDDEVTTRNLCNDVALEAGLHAYTSATTEQALDILDQYPIDIVVTDLKIPEIGGWNSLSGFAGAIRRFRSLCSRNMARSKRRSRRRGLEP